MDPDREHRVEAGDAEPERRDTDHLERDGYLNVALQDGAGDIELWAVNKGTGVVEWKSPVASGNFRINKQNMSSPSPVTDGSGV